MPPVTPPAHIAGRRAGGPNCSSSFGCTSLNSRCPHSRRLHGKRIRNFLDRQYLFKLVDAFPILSLSNPKLKEKLRNDSTKLPKNKNFRQRACSVLGSVKDDNATPFSGLAQNVGSKQCEALSQKAFFMESSKNVRHGTGPRSYPVGTAARWYWGVDRRRSLLNLADHSHSEDILALA